MISSLTEKADLADMISNNYAAELIEKGFQEERIRKYGFAFEGQRVLIG